MSKQEPSIVAQCIIVKFLMKENAKSIERLKNSSQMTVFQEPRYLSSVTYIDKERERTENKSYSPVAKSLNDNNMNRVNDVFLLIYCIMIYLLIFTKIMIKFLKI